MLLEQLHQAGYSAEVSAKGRYLAGLIPLLSGLYELDFLKEAYMLRLLNNAQIRKGRAYPFSELLQIAHPGAQIEAFRQRMYFLAARQAFSRGYLLSCPRCDLTDWYPLDAVNEMTTCQGCRFSFQLPLELEFAFKPNRLLIEALKAGALTHLLLLNQWLHISPVIQWHSGIEVQKGSIQTDIDLLVKREDGLFMAECKDNFKTDAESLSLLISQLATVAHIAREIGARPAFATLYEGELPDELQDYLQQHEIFIIDRNSLLNANNDKKE